MSRIQFPNGLDEAAFLTRYWQKKPLYMPNAWPDFDHPLSPEELAGLAMEEGIPARIIQQHSDDRWSLRHGPFSSADFAELEGGRWSLLITDIEKYLPDFRRYLEPFRFIPDWRFDDLMISYAPPGGSVGPHVDDYDVFLLQAQGEREWRLESGKRALPMPEDEMIAGTDLRLIREFQMYETHRCAAGDILYLPPRIGHHGIAQNDCMTWSFGFRAPVFNDLLGAWLDHFTAQNEHQRFTDPGLEPQACPGEITAIQLGRIKSWFLDQLDHDDEHFYRFVAAYLSEINDPELLPDGAHVGAFEWLDVEPNPFVRFDFIRLDGRVLLYAGGEEFSVSLDLAKKITSRKRLRLIPASDGERELLARLVAKGFLLPVD